jgi:hypothetical protein
MSLTSDARAALDELTERVERLETRNQNLTAENKQQNEQIERLLEENAEDRQRIAELEDYRADNERDKATIRQQVTKVEEREPASSDDANSDGRDTKGRSPLAQLIDVPAERATEFLSVNQRRGRKVAQCALEIGTETPSGLVVRSDEVANYLRRWDESSHTETVSRVMDFIDQLGCDDVHSKMHKGRRILVFELDRVKSYGMGEEPAGIKSQRDVIPMQMNDPGTATA